ncbi:30S ribosomal protein S15 [Spiroplasma tabanidicola]|uniref:Small ribosomal subunit protein uS15 n=1 Tax=Spiroplasma tabanidicola TaxID=324079 RepID=A0A6I6C8Q8_9MOLU|nr:30S ribosomal protein S15 [Spiroplasma tabanidicola]QGS51849.1 30S ribosomal protein S15 [Spiroplasma tabanidicola]
MVSNKEKTDIVKQFGSNDKDTGKAEVQIALLTSDIKNLQEHSQKHKKDYSSIRSLVKKVAQRRHLLNYLLKKDVNRYKAVIEKLGIRK